MLYLFLIVKKLELQKKLMDELGSKKIDYPHAKLTEKEFNRSADDEISKLDMKIIMELDQAVCYLIHFNCELTNGIALLFR